MREPMRNFFKSSLFCEILLTVTSGIFSSRTGKEGTAVIDVDHKIVIFIATLEGSAASLLRSAQAGKERLEPVNTDIVFGFDRLLLVTWSQSELWVGH